MLLEENTVNLLKDLQKQSIKAKSLVEEQLKLIYKNKWFNIWVPSIYNGLELSLIDGFNLIKELAYHDGGLAWTITLCSGANMFAGFIDPQVAKEVFSQPNVCFGGSGKVAGKAIWDGNKYEISGSWTYATGAPHLTHFTLNAYVFDHDVQRMDNDGNAVIYSFFVPKEHVLVHYDWNTFGLECTASHNFSLHKVTVDQKYAFRLIPEASKISSTLYKIPFLTFAELTLLPNYLGMYKKFLDLVEKYFFEKSQDEFWAQKFSKVRFKKVDNYQLKLIEYLKTIEELIRRLWELVETNEEFLEDTLHIVSSKSRQIVKEIRESVIELFPLVGISGAQMENEINIVFRNLFTATQHSLLNTEKL